MLWAAFGLVLILLNMQGYSPGYGLSENIWVLELVWVMG